jgi:hypothetical protein
MIEILVFPAILIVLFLPGIVWLGITRSTGIDPLEQIAEAAGASLALTGLVALYLFVTGIRLSGGGMIGIYLAVLTVGGVTLALRGFRWRLHVQGVWLLAIGAALGVVAWRLYQTRGLALPVWVDPVHHVLLVRKILEYGGLPPNWLPYLPVPMYYHYGFHVLAAAFSFWSQIQPAQAVLVFGQVINAMVGLSVYRLAKAAWGDVLRAGLAGLFTVFAFHMPAYYLSWGRYTLLAGMVVLPLAMAAALEVRRSPANRAAWERLALYTAAVCFCEYLTAGILALFFLVLAGAEALRWLRARSLRVTVWQPFAAAALGVLIVSPWLVRVWSYTHQMFSVQVPDPFSATSDAAGLWEYIIFLTGPQRSHILLILAGVGLLVGLIHGRARLMAVWALLLAFLSTPYGPRFQPFRPDLLAICLFLPGSLLLAELIIWLGEQAGRLQTLFQTLIARRTTLPTNDLPPAGVPSIRRPMAALLLPALIGLGLAGWGIWETRDIVNPVTVLAQPADLAAMDWVNQNTPADARFFINSIQWFPGSFRGTDGGYWLLTLTGRFGVVPPAAYGWGPPDEVLRFTDWARRASLVTACDSSFWSLVHDAGLNYVYLHQGAGSLQPAAMTSCQGAETVYDQEGVSIYRLSPASPDPSP